MTPLTAKQRALLEFIEQRSEQDGIVPSYQEMMEATNLKSKSGVHRIILALESRGFIRRRPAAARCLEIIRGSSSQSIVHIDVVCNERGDVIKAYSDRQALVTLVTLFSETSWKSENLPVHVRTLEAAQ